MALSSFVATVESVNGLSAFRQNSVSNAAIGDFSRLGGAQSSIGELDANPSWYPSPNQSFAPDFEDRMQERPVNVFETYGTLDTTFAPEQGMQFARESALDQPQRLQSVVGVSCFAPPRRFFDGHPVKEHVRSVWDGGGVDTIFVPGQGPVYPSQADRLHDGCSSFYSERARFEDTTANGRGIGYADSVMTETSSPPPVNEAGVSLPPLPPDRVATLAPITLFPETQVPRRTARRQISTRTIPEFSESMPADLGPIIDRLVPAISPARQTTAVESKHAAQSDRNAVDARGTSVVATVRQRNHGGEKDALHSAEVSESVQCKWGEDGSSLWLDHGSQGVRIEPYWKDGRWFTAAPVDFRGLDKAGYGFRGPVDNVDLLLQRAKNEGKFPQLPPPLTWRQAASCPIS